MRAMTWHGGRALVFAVALFVPSLALTIHRWYVEQRLEQARELEARAKRELAEAIRRAGQELEHQCRARGLGTECFGERRPVGDFWTSAELLRTQGETDW
jgi:hypothetical protein